MISLAVQAIVALFPTPKVGASKRAFRSQVARGARADWRLSGSRFVRLTVARGRRCEAWVLWVTAVKASAGRSNCYSDLRCTFVISPLCSSDKLRSQGMVPTVLSVESLSTHFRLADGRIFKAVDGVSFSIGTREIFGLVGESGCGKTTLGLSILRLLPPEGTLSAGSMKLSGRELQDLTAKELRSVRGRQVTMIFQNAAECLDPTVAIGSQIAAVLRLHAPQTKDEARSESVRLLRLVGFPEPAERFMDYPHQLSAGMCQRVMIAMALACRPSLLIADEPTSSLDVTVQAQIMELLRKIRHQFDMSILLISHDLGVIAQTCDRVAVMYAGQLVEQGSVFDVFGKPQHAYTRLLLQSVPATDPKLRADYKQALVKNSASL